MSSSDKKQMGEDIKKIYQDYLEKLDELKREQNQLLDDFTKKLEDAKKEEIMNKIGK